MINFATLAGIISRVRFSFTSEAELQRGIAETLERANVHFEREYRLSGADRIDFFLADHGMGIEVKIDGSTSALTRQLLRYAESDEIKSLSVITSRMRHAVQMPASMNGKPLQVITVGGIA